MLSTATPAPAEKSAAPDTEKGLGAARVDRPPTSDGSVDVVSEREVESAVEDGVGGEADEQRTVLPFSKGRCISLVLTVTGAAFLNVRLLGMSNSAVC
jgi:hypothetical protein